MNGLASYDRQPKETPKAWEAFQVFRDLGTKRNLKAVAAELGKGVPGIQKWSGKWKWKPRVRDWDDEQDRIAEHRRQVLEGKAAEQTAKAQAAMIKRHANVAEGMSRVVGDKLAAFLQDKCDKCGQGNAQLSPKDMAQWLAVSARLERVCRGLPADGERAPLIQINSTHITINPVSLISDPEARALNAQLLRRLSTLDRVSREEQAGVGAAN